MGRIWLAFILFSLLVSIASGQTQAVSQALLESGARAVQLCLTLTGAMALWSGLMRVMEETGDVARLGRALRRVLAPLFAGVQDDAAWNAMSLNLTANVFGLGNAATPAGIEAARRLCALGESGRRALAMLLALNNSSLQLIPATVMALRGAAGASSPADIWLPTLISSAAATLVAALLMLLWNRRKGCDAR